MTQPPQPQRDPFDAPDRPEPVQAATGPTAPSSPTSETTASDTRAGVAAAAMSAPPEPPNLPFDLQEGENVIKVARRHWAFLAVHLGRDLLIGLGPIIVVALIINWTTGFDGAFGTWAIVAMVAWLVFWAVRAYFTWYQYQNDQWVITNQRIVDSRKRNWFHQEMSSADLVNVQDMSIRKEGIFATIFGYGDLNCQTAGSSEKFVLSGIPDTKGILALVDRYRDAAKRDLVRGNIV